jgi:hypothetical protein
MIAHAWAGVALAIVSGGLGQESGLWEEEHAPDNEASKAI